MIGIPEIGSLENAVISGVAHKGLWVTTPDGKPAHLAVVDGNGTIVEIGPQVAQEAWNVTLNCYMNFLTARGYRKVHTSPPT